ncbi:cytochrome d ubiquinol oxidase subunit II [Desmospora profundinema]|uniref:Cytochrome d ubiquinol oxidase subunit II n=1 Tax=Desmospora profundinema TaxID=1571184 RepID=A0ABU1ISA1_9BACL|nr:cytochrome d ubiquinol oxidase subunit II [Desmospora profundinema]MDR6226814.1 cytochrome d ubiquinol oxidase subunit II [Desmospora profundinema]
MNDALVAISILWLFVFMYAILGSVDFGAGFWGMVYSRRGKTRAGALANRFLSPTWEVTNVFLVLLVVTLVTFFPTAVYPIGMALLVPGSLVLLLLTFRSTFMVFQYNTDRFQEILSVVSGVTGLLIPSLLVLVLPILTGGFIDPDTGELMLGALFTRPISYAYLTFGLSSELFLSSAFLSDYSREADDDEAYRVFRNHARWLGPVALLAGITAVFLMGYEAVWLRQGIEAQRWWFLASGILFLTGYAALWIKPAHPRWSRGLPRLAFVCFIGQYALASLAYGRAHLPYMVYPDITVDAAVTNPAMFRSLLVSYAIGLAILIPGFYYFWQLFLKDKRYLHRE